MDHSKFWVLLSIALAALGCEPDSPEPIRGIGARDAGGDEPDASELEPEPQLIGVVSTDYGAASIALLDPEGEILDDDFINSGSATAGLVTALSGDVSLPTRSGDPGTLTILDRFRTDVLTRIDPESGEVLGQVKTQEPNAQDDEAGYSSNPHDYVYLGPNDAWISRFQPNVNAGTDDPDRGLDLLHVDPTDFERGERISLWHLNGQAERTNASTGETDTVTVYARPSGIVRLGALLVVGISSLSLTFDAVGAGMVALVDPEAKTAEGLELPGLQNCGSVAPIPHEDARVVVACQGFFRGVQRDTAGLAILRLEDGELSIEHLWRVKDDEDAALAVSSVVSIGGTEVVASSNGASAEGTNDAMYVVDVASGEQTKLFEADGQFKIGGGYYDARRKVLFVPDASTDANGRPSAGIRTFERASDGRFEAREVIEVHDVLPPRQVAAL